MAVVNDNESMTAPGGPGRVLLRGGAVVSMDPEWGTLERADVLVEGGRIAAVAPDVGDVDADIVDTTGMIVAPGLVDTHRHTWQTQLRGLCADWTLTDYFNGVRLLASPCYGPDDVRLGNRAGALEAVDAGVTTILDFSHCMNSPDHAEGAVEGLVSSGIRALHCHGFFESAPLASGFADHGARRRYFEQLAASGRFGDRVRLGVALTETGLIPWSDTVAEITAARAAGVPMAAHTGCLWGSRVTGGILDMEAGGLLGPDQVHVHGNTLRPDEWRALAGAGAKVSTSPETELNMGMGALAIAPCVAHGMAPTLSCDVVSLNAGDLFTQMRLALASVRQADNEPINRAGAMPARLTFRAADALTWATGNGADALGLGDRIGSVTPGKEADLMVVGGPAFGAWPVVDPEASLVFQTSAAAVRHVLIGGRWAKRDGVLVGVDTAALRRDVEVSAAGILTRMRARSPQLPPAPLFDAATIEEFAAANFAAR
jgi:cytosine/adenosine deaminase-related metal-dependent hydrolase